MCCSWNRLFTLSKNECWNSWLKIWFYSLQIVWEFDNRHQSESKLWTLIGLKILDSLCLVRYIEIQQVFLCLDIIKNVITNRRHNLWYFSADTQFFQPPTKYKQGFPLFKYREWQGQKWPCWSKDYFDYHFQPLFRQVQLSPPSLKPEARDLDKKLKVVGFVLTIHYENNSQVIICFEQGEISIRITHPNCSFPV